MPNYKNSKIYKVICETGLIYIGSTTQPLKERLRKHKSGVCRCKDFINPKIELIENYECESRKELLTKERYYIESIECVNTQIPLQSRKEYYTKNKDKLKKLQKERYENNKEVILEKNKEYSKRLDRRQYYKEWRKKNVEKCKEYDLKKKLVSK